MRARRLLALVLALATFGLADLALGHAHPARGGAETAMASAEAAPTPAAARCVVCPGVSTWRAGGAPSAAPAAGDAPVTGLRPCAASAPHRPGRLAAIAGGPRAPPASR